MNISKMKSTKKLRFSLVFALSLLSIRPIAAQNAGEPFDPRTIVFIGSSLIDFWKTLPQDFPDEKVLNLGVAGTTYSHLVANAEEWAEKYPADRYVIYSGDNDIAWLSSPEKVVRQFRKLADTLRATLPNVHIYVLSIKPSLITTRRIHINSVRKANAMLAAEAAAIGNATYVDIHNPMLNQKGKPRAELFVPDGIHMNEKGYRIWQDVLRPILKK